MSAFSNTLLSFLVLLLVLKVASQGDTTTFTYNTFSSISPSLIYQGDAFVPSSSSLARLTGVNCSGVPTRGSIGRLVYFPPVKFWDEGVQATFETTIKFSITDSPSNPNPPGEGLAFFIAPVNSPIPPGSAEGNFGLYNPQTGLAPSVFSVEFDPAPNTWDPTYTHVGININSRVSKNVSDFSGVGQEVTARIYYFSPTRTISVVATYGSQTSTLSYVFDLKTVLPKEVQVGITATTGSWVAFQDISAWYFSSTPMWDGNNLDKTYVPQYVS